MPQSDERKVPTENSVEPFFLAGVNEPRLGSLDHLNTRCAKRIKTGRLLRYEVFRSGNVNSSNHTITL